MARLIFKFKDRILHVFPLTLNQPLTIGRRPENDIVIDNLAVSGHHARVQYNGQGVMLVDLQSKNGTFVNGERILETALQHEDAVTIGKHTLIADLTESIAVDGESDTGIEPGESPASFSDSQTMLLDTPAARQMRGEEPPPPPPPEPEHPETDLLSVLSGGDSPLTISQKPITIGKNKDADIVVGGVWGLLLGSPAATIKKQAGDVFLRFNGGLIKPRRNGTGVKGTVKLNHEDIVEIGPVKLQVQLSKRSAS
jgi:pSer/pThr/pTyr-binding forkhead associated (FHA) protein